MSIEVREEQESNACSPIEVTESGMFMVAREVQHSNAEEPIEVTLEGIVIEANFLQ